MAGLTKEQRAAKAAAMAASTASDSTPEAHADAPALVSMTKDGETLDVHPSCVHDHFRLGWTLAG
jgi:hypothetical protein